MLPQIVNFLVTTMAITAPFIVIGVCVLAERELTRLSRRLSYMETAYQAVVEILEREGECRVETSEYQDDADRKYYVRVQIYPRRLAGDQLPVVGG